MFPGCVVGVVSSGGDREIFPFGRFTYESGSPEVREDTIYDLASITKSIPLASLALTLIAERNLNLNEKVKAFIPELQNDHGATVEDLLRYRVRGPRLSHLRFRTHEEIRTHVFEHGFDGPPGESEYANVPAYVLGFAVERIGGESLATLGHKYFFEPLKMERTNFFPERSACAPTEIQDGKVIQGIVHDESARVFAKAGRTVGQAGLFSTAGDLLNFVETLFRKSGFRKSGPGFMKSRFSVIAEGAEAGLGWEVNDGHRKSIIPKGTFGKTGFPGTSVVVDRAKGKALVILSNRTYPRRHADSSAINSFRCDIADIVFA